MKAVTFTLTKFFVFSFLNTSENIFNSLIAQNKFFIIVFRDFDVMI